MNFNCSVIPNFHKETKKKKKQEHTKKPPQPQNLIKLCFAARKKKPIHCLNRHYFDYFQWTAGENVISFNQKSSSSLKAGNGQSMQHTMNHLSILWWSLRRKKEYTEELRLNFIINIELSYLHLYLGKGIWRIITPEKAVQVFSNHIKYKLRPTK